MLVASPAGPETAAQGMEQTFDMLQIGSHTYRNVTVTTKSKDYVFLLHSAGMTNIKIAELTPDLREKLGYAQLDKAKPQATNATAWAKQTIAKLQTPQVKAVEQQVVSTWQRQLEAANIQIPPITRELLLQILAAAAAIYLFYCYCCMLICRKAGQKPGLLVWLPGLQLLPLLRAAGMSRWWFLAYLVPGLNLIAHLVWCFKIAAARLKTALVAIGLFLPPTSWIAFLYLAFSNGGVAKPREPRERHVEIMTLETA